MSSQAMLLPPHPPPAERVLRLLIALWVRISYRFRAQGLEHLPSHGAAILVCNHVSFIDPLLVGVATHRKVRFVMDHRIFRNRVLHRFFRTIGAIPIAPRSEDHSVREQAFDRIAASLRAGELLCIFPEGMITHTGAMNPFRPGIERILATTPVPVIPMALHGLWGSFFSRKGGPAMRKPPRRFRAPISLRCGPPVPPHSATANHLQHLVTKLLLRGPGDDGRGRGSRPRAVTQPHSSLQSKPPSADPSVRRRGHVRARTGPSTAPVIARSPQ
jgi:1-acyl-sn-glycerol-3-phosphate acyltransferase